MLTARAQVYHLLDATYRTEPTGWYSLTRRARVAITIDSTFETRVLIPVIYMVMQT